MYMSIYTEAGGPLCCVEQPLPLSPAPATPPLTRPANDDNRDESTMTTTAPLPPPRRDGSATATDLPCISPAPDTPLWSRLPVGGRCAAFRRHSASRSAMRSVGETSGICAHAADG